MTILSGQYGHLHLSTSPPGDDCSRSGPRASTGPVAKWPPESWAIWAFEDG